MAESRLTVNSGTTYQVESGTTEEYYGAEVDGTLDVDGTLKLIDNPETTTYDVVERPEAVSVV